jgi:choline transport protein
MTGPSVAFNAYVASCTIFLNISYALPVFILLIRGRKILSRETQASFSLGKYGYGLNIVGVLFVAVTSVVRIPQLNGTTRHLLTS